MCETLLTVPARMSEVDDHQNKALQFPHSGFCGQAPGEPQIVGKGFIAVLSAFRYTRCAHR